MWVCFVQLKMLYPNDGFFFIHNLRYLKSLKVFLHMLTLSFFTDINYTRMIFPKCTPMDIDVLKQYFSRSILVLKHEKKIHLKLIKQEVKFAIFFSSPRNKYCGVIILILIPYSGPNNKSSVPCIISCPCYYNGPY